MKQNSKRAISFLLALCLLLALQVPVLGAETEDYEFIAEYVNGYASAVRDGKWGILDMEGREVVPCAYESTYPFDCAEVFLVMQDGKMGLFDAEGVQRVPFRYDRIFNYCSHGLFPVSLDSKRGYVDLEGREVVPLLYEEVRGFFGPTLLAAAELNGKWGFVDTQGKLVVPCVYDEVYEYEDDGYAAVRLGEKYGFLDTRGVEVVPVIYDDIRNFLNCDLAPVQLEGKWGYIDRQGKEVVPCLYDDLAAFGDNGVAMFVRDGKFGFLDTQGREFIPARYDGAYAFDPLGHACVMREGLWGVVDLAGNEIVPLRYDAIYATEPCGLFPVMQEELFGLVDTNGQETVPCTLTLEELQTQLAELNAKVLPKAVASTQTVLLDGREVEFQCYALLDEKGYPTNYIRLRDLALLLNGTAAQFGVGWDGKVLLSSGSPYESNGSELSTPFTGDRAYTIVVDSTWLDGEAVELAAIRLTDDNGGGYTYYKLRDLGAALDFNVGWDKEAKRVYVETDKPYDPAN